MGSWVSGSTLCMAERRSPVTGSGECSLGVVLLSGSVAWPTDSFHRNWENNLMWFYCWCSRTAGSPGLRWRWAGKRWCWHSSFCWPALSALLVKFSPLLPGQAQPALGDPWVTIQPWVFVLVWGFFFFLKLTDSCLETYKWHSVKGRAWKNYLCWCVCMCVQYISHLLWKVLWMWS